MACFSFVGCCRLYDVYLYVLVILCMCDRHRRSVGRDERKRAPTTVLCCYVVCVCVHYYVPSNDDHDDDFFHVFPCRLLIASVVVAWVLLLV